MFPSRFFPGRVFAPRYFPRPAAPPPSPPDADRLTGAETLRQAVIGQVNP